MPADEFPARDEEVRVEDGKPGGLVGFVLLLPEVEAHVPEVRVQDRAVLLLDAAVVVLVVRAGARDPRLEHGLFHIPGSEKGFAYVRVDRLVQGLPVGRPVAESRLRHLLHASILQDP